MHLDLLPHFDPGDFDKEVEDTERIKDDMFASMAKVDYALSHLSSAPPTAANLPAVSTSRAMTKLPKLSLQKFSGSLIGWSPFWDAYKAAIHDNSSLTNVEKFSYLQTLLEGKAKDTVAGLALTEANYSVAVDLLECRFGDKEKTIAVHMEKLMNLAPVLSDLHTGELRRLYDKVEASIRSLEALGVDLTSYGALLTQVFVQKLPQELKLILARKVPAAEWKMKKLLEVFLEELEARERTASTSPKTKEPQNAKRSKEYPTTRTFMSSGNAGCCYCGEEGHTPVHCKKVASIEDRKRYIRENGLMLQLPAAWPYRSRLLLDI